ncbi:MAG: BON domain-containing protein [Planctomycetaceae bacterium]|jgi:hypothetical protein|nr:BON domain-containing protein [Planctomycetaceae bacterium]
MKYSFFQIVTVLFFVSVFSVVVSAQNLGDLGNIGGGNIGGGIGGGNIGSGNLDGNGNTGNRNNNGSSSYSNSGSDSTGSEFGSTIETPTFQGFRDPASQSFIGRDNSVPFIGREEPFSDRQTSTNNRRTTTSTTTSTRRTTSSRMTTANRSMSGRSGLNSATNNGRTVRATTQTEFMLSPGDVDQRTTDFQTRITRLPRLQVVPEQIGVTLASTSQGNIATLTGTVSSERERKILKQLLLLEPGIDKVDNRLTINIENQ